MIEVPNGRLWPESIEDLAILDDRGVLREAIQIKGHTAPLTLSELLSKSGKGLLQRVIGTRPVPASLVDLRCSKYEVHGIIDVLTHIALSQAADNNLIRQRVLEACPSLRGTYEVIVDYKGARRPLTDESYWEQGDWQLQT